MVKIAPSAKPNRFFEIHTQNSNVYSSSTTPLSRSHLRYILVWLCPAQFLPYSSFQLPSQMYDGVAVSCIVLHYSSFWRPSQVCGVVVSCIVPPLLLILASISVIYWCQCVLHRSSATPPSRSHLRYMLCPVYSSSATAPSCSHLRSILVWLFPVKFLCYSSFSLDPISGI